MRLWSLHPKYLDQKGLLALWREALLAKKVLEGKTKGYVNHPQLWRFKNHPKPVQAINFYLHKIWIEAKIRGYNFDRSKINKLSKKMQKIKLTQGQIDYEFNHLKAKLRRRNQKALEKIMKTKKVRQHPLFVVIKGSVEQWEK